MSILASIDTLIAFVTVMLLFSLLVTGMVQATQAIFRLRGRNLRVALTRMLLRSGIADEKSVQDLADRILNGRLLLPKQEPRLVRMVPKAIRSTGASNIEDDQLRHLLAEEGGLQLPPREETSDSAALPERDESGFSERFGLMETVASKRFQTQIRFVTIFWAVVIAFTFQLSLFDVLRDVSTNEALRADLVKASETVSRQAEAALRSVAVQDVSEQALEQLAERYPPLKPKLEEISGIGGNKEALLDEIRLAGHDDPALRRVIPEYESLLTDLHQQKVQAALDISKSAVTQLARYNYTLWPNGIRYYGFESDSSAVPVATNWLGVIASVILLTFGAPFWFEQLKNLARLKDGLQQVQRRGKK